ncbi:PepSY-associated TM helix domain-containing protein [Deefgea piscis]|uniref:PepSY-associated TM helix domain-containing protein n=1 Tax=Deefgea piscis TaxID=2739061 RepID=UPI001C8257F6|nr:PepSY domain-containing protein [Deefgea piscis]QZA81526.1 PepSY domain-containing protein [Deefgea piscis]
MSKTKPANFYAVVWRWHFYAGLLVIPVLMLLVVTGAIYLFKPQLDPLLYPQLLRVSPAKQQVTADTMVATLTQNYPAMQVTKYTPAEQIDRSAQFKIQLADGAERLVFIDPYRNQILGEQDFAWTLQGIALRLHGELLLGPWGDALIELAASWSILLVLSGWYLWWPSKAGVWGTFLPRLGAGKRVFWRDLHAVGGFWCSGVLLFLLLTGLPWTGIWGEKFAEVWQRYPSALWNQLPESTPLTRSLNSTVDKAVPWAVEAAPLPHSEHAAHQSQPLATTALSLTQIQGIASQLNMQAGLSISPPKDAKGVYTLSLAVDDPVQQRTLHLDQYSGKVLADIRFADYGWVPKAVEYGIAIHEGKYFGLPNQLLMLSACVLLILISISGVVMWLKRRPVGQFAAPKTAQSLLHWKTGSLILLALALLLPMVLISVLLVFALDFLLLRRA